MAISYQQLKPSYTFQYWSQISSQIAVDRSTKVLVATTTTTTRHPSDQMIWSRKWKQSPGWLDWLILVITEYNWWRGSSWYLNYWSGSALSHHSKQNRGGAREPVYNLCSLINKRLLWYVVWGQWSVKCRILKMILIQITDWSIFSLPVEVRCVATGLVGSELFILPRAPSSLRDVQSGASWRPVICCCCSWPNITTLDSSLVVNITPSHTQLVRLHVITFKSLSGLHSSQIFPM